MVNNWVVLICSISDDVQGCNGLGRYGRYLQRSVNNLEVIRLHIKETVPTLMGQLQTS